MQAHRTGVAARAAETAGDTEAGGVARRIVAGIAIRRVLLARLVEQTIPGRLRGSARHSQCPLA